MAFSLVQRKLFETSAKIFEKNLAGSSFGVLNILHESVEVKKVHTITVSASRTISNNTTKSFTQIAPTHISTTKSVAKHVKTIPSVCNGNFCLINKQQARHISSSEYSSSKKSSKEKVEHEFDDSDSDSDCDEIYDKKHPKGKQRGDSEFWRRKMRTLHGILDINNDGVISFEDFMLLSRKFTDLGHLCPETSTEFINVMKKTWEEQWGEITPYNLITAEQFLTDMHHVLNDKELVKKMGKFLPYLFKAVDTDHSGYLDLNQFKLFFNCLGLTDEDAAVSFAVIDKNADGKLTLKEFCKLGKEYFLTEDERRVSKMFWGPLLNH